MSAMNIQKVFNIGFHKTGTSSLTKFMVLHGFKALHNVSHSMEFLGIGSQFDTAENHGATVDLASLIDVNTLDKLVGMYDFFSDNPWPMLYELLDSRYPDSKFILTRRSETAWINSALAYFGTQDTKMRQMIYGYGSPVNNVERYLQVYQSHNRSVCDYFKNKQNFLLIDIEDDNKLITDRIVEFMRLENSNIVFPSSKVPFTTK